MCSLLPSLTLALAMLLGGVHALAQGTAPADAPVNTGRTAPGAQETRTERIQVEDEDARIDELRVGGETRTISVKPKGGMPAYDVAPKTGERTWKVLGF
jgi:hypothetical protein